jgi:hypothetical protein
MRVVAVGIVIVVLASFPQTIRALTTNILIRIQTMITGGTP